MSENLTLGVLRQRTAEEIRVQLARKRLTGSELARRMGVTQPYISRRLTGDIPFDLDDLEKVGAVLNVEVADLLPRSVTHPAGPEARDTRYKPTVTNQPSPIGRPSRQGPRQSTRRPARKVPFIAELIPDFLLPAYDES